MPGVREARALTCGKRRFPSQEASMKARIKWVEQVTFLAESGSGHAVVLDGAPDAGGRNLGVRPMEMLLMGLGGCSAFDVVLILRKWRVKTLGSVSALSASSSTTQSVTSSRPLRRIRTTSKAEQPPNPMSSISMG